MRVCVAVWIQIAGAGPEASSSGGKQEGDPTGLISGHMSSSGPDGEYTVSCAQLDKERK